MIWSANGTGSFSKKNYSTYFADFKIFNINTVLIKYNQIWQYNHNTLTFLIPLSCHVKSLDHDQPRAKLKGVDIFQ